MAWVELAVGVPRAGSNCLAVLWCSLGLLVPLYCPWTVRAGYSQWNGEKQAEAEWLLSPSPGCPRSLTKAPNSSSDARQNKDLPCSCSITVSCPIVLTCCPPLTTQTPLWSFHNYFTLWGPVGPLWNNLRHSLFMNVLDPVCIEVLRFFWLWMVLWSCSQNNKLMSAIGDTHCVKTK